MTFYFHLVRKKMYTTSHNFAVYKRVNTELCSNAQSLNTNDNRIKLIEIRGIGVLGFIGILKTDSFYYRQSKYSKRQTIAHFKYILINSQFR